MLASSTAIAPFLLLFGLFFFSAAHCGRDLRALVPPASPITVSGVVDKVDVAGSVDGRPTSYTIRVRFSVDGRMVVVDRTVDPGPLARLNAPVTVLVDNARPKAAHVEGTRVLSPVAAAIGGVPALLGLLVVGIGVVRTRRRLHLLRHGVFTRAHERSSRETRRTIRHLFAPRRRRHFDDGLRPSVLYVLTFLYADTDGRMHQREIKTYHPLPVIDEREAGEGIVFDADDPASALLLDEIPFSPRIVDDTVEFSGTALGKLALLVWVIFGTPALLMALSFV